MMLIICVLIKFYIRNFYKNNVYVKSNFYLNNCQIDKFKLL